MSEPPRDRQPPRAPRASDGPRPVREVVERLRFDRTPPAAPSRRRPGKIITGKLVAHGRANYQFEAGGSPSYYVKILSTRGPETLWGVDLERALKRSKTQPKIGTMIGARRVGSEIVTLGTSGAGRGDAAPRTARRAQWIVENITFFAEALQRSRRDREAQLADARTLRERPELRSAFISLRVAEKFAERSIRDPRDRALFIERVKAVMALSARQGASIPAPRLASREQTPRPEDPTR